MPLSLSPAADILATIRDYITAQILPDLRDDKWFNVKIAVNMLAVVERELRLKPRADAEESERLEELTGADGPLEKLNHILAQAVRERKLSLDDPRLLDHLRQTTTDTLRINNPQWLQR